MEEKDRNLVSQGLDVEGKVKVFYEILEDVASKVFKKKKEFSEEKLESKRSKNKIPKEDS